MLAQIGLHNIHTQNPVTIHCINGEDEDDDGIIVSWIFTVVCVFFCWEGGCRRNLSWHTFHLEPINIKNKLYHWKYSSSLLFSLLSKFMDTMDRWPAATTHVFILKVHTWTASFCLHKIIGYIFLVTRMVAQSNLLLDWNCIEEATILILGLSLVIKWRTYLEHNNAHNLYVPSYGSTSFFIVDYIIYFIVELVISASHVSLKLSSAVIKHHRWFTMHIL